MLTRQRWSAALHLHRNCLEQIGPFLSSPKVKKIVQSRFTGSLVSWLVWEFHTLVVTANICTIILFYSRSAVQSAFQNWSAVRSCEFRPKRVLTVRRQSVVQLPLAQTSRCVDWLAAPAPCSSHLRQLRRSVAPATSPPGAERRPDIVGCTNFRTSVCRRAQVMSTVQSVVPRFKSRFSAVLQIFFCRRKAAVVSDVEIY